MDQFSTQERIKIIELYFATKSPVLVQRQFRREFPGRKIPHRNTIRALVEKFRDTGTVRNNNRGHSGPPLTATNPPHVQDVRARLEASPRKSTRRLSQEVGVSRTSVRRIIKKELKLFPYKVQILQAQTQANKHQRYEFCQKISERIESNPDLLDVSLFHGPRIPQISAPQTTSSGVT